MLPYYEVNTQEMQADMDEAHYLLEKWLIMWGKLTEGLIGYGDQIQTPAATSILTRTRNWIKKYMMEV